MKKIAVIEDNADNRLLVRVLLEPAYQVSEYANGPDALEGLRRQKPDLVLLDISLPGMDGLEILGHLRADAALRDLPVVALTAHAMKRDREQFLAQGFDAYIAKPITDENELFGTIERLVADAG